MKSSFKKYLGAPQVLKEKTLIIRTEEETKRDAEVLQEAKVAMGELKDHAQNRDGFRDEGSALGIFKMLSERGESVE